MSWHWGVPSAGVAGRIVLLTRGRRDLDLSHSGRSRGLGAGVVRIGEWPGSAPRGAPRAYGDHGVAFGCVVVWRSTLVGQPTDVDDCANTHCWLPELRGVSWELGLSGRPACTRRGVGVGVTQAAVRILLVGGYLYIRVMATFITGIHHCPDCGEAQVGSRAFVESTSSGSHVDWCAFQCRNGHIWARPGMQAVK